MNTLLKAIFGINPVWKMFTFLGVFFFLIAAMLYARDEEARQAATASKMRPDVVADAKPKKHGPRALYVAAMAYDIDPVLLLAISRIETAGTFSVNIRPRRKNGKTIGTARGLCQMIKATAKTVKTNWNSLNPYEQADACARFTSQNVQALKSGLNRPPSDVEVYYAHFMGVRAALRFIRLSGKLSVQKAFPARVLKANTFLVKMRTVAGVRLFYERKLADAKEWVRIHFNIKGRPARL